MLAEVTATTSSSKGPTPTSLASVLGANRDGSAAASSSRGLLITVMGEFVLPNGASAWTQSVISLMELLGIRSKATRQALLRLENQGWMSRERVGRQTRWLMTETFARLLTDGAQRIYGFGTQPAAWDRRWLIVYASVPERDRNIRYRMGLGLSWAGLGSLGNGIWIGPWTDREPTVVELLADLKVEATSFVADLGTLGSADDLVGAAWNLPELAGLYEDFTLLTEATAPRVSSSSIGIETSPEAFAAARLTDLVHRWRRFPFLDPGLPVELLPDDWPGFVAANSFAQARSELHASAQTWWQSTESGFSP